MRNGIVLFISDRGIKPDSDEDKVMINLDKLATRLGLGGGS